MFEVLFPRFADRHVLAFLGGLPRFVRRLLFSLVLAWIDTAVDERLETSRSLLRLIDSPASRIADRDPYCRAVYFSLEDVRLGASSRGA
ncbi:hypothetical protein WK11_28030 [Burkholderia ubonensis]|nr:hypothetical protein WK11_28030 [Burkholderia ubonensis]